MVFADFDAVFMDFNAVFVDFDVDLADFGLKLVKLTISFQSTVRILGGNIKFFFENLQNARFSPNPWILAKTTILSEL